MMTPEAIAVVQSRIDQLLRTAEEHLEAIQRVAMEGPQNNEDDKFLVVAVFSLMAAMLMLIQALRERDEEPDSL